MAVETESRQETLRVEQNGHRNRVRLHVEILPPTLEPPTPATARSARRALAIMAAGMILIQVVSTPIGHWLNSVARSGTDAYSVWQHYASNPVPDVLVIGASSTRSDIDEQLLSTELSAAAGRTVTLERAGFAGQTPQFLDALMYRVMKRTPHPKLIMVVIVGPELNAGCGFCLRAANGALWDISDLTDPGFVTMALHVSPNPVGLAAGWALPTLAYYTSLIALQCVAFDWGRGVANTVLGRVPLQLQHTSACEETLPYKAAHQIAMQPADYELSVTNFGEEMHDYQISPEAASSLTDIVSRGRAGGANVVFLETPLNPGIRVRFPGEIQESQLQMGNLASSLHTGLVDLSESVPSDPSLWADGLHLSPAGADYFGPMLARALLPVLTG